MSILKCTQLSFCLLFYRFESWSLTLKETIASECLIKKRLKMYEPNMAEVIGGWRKFHKEKLHNLNPSSDVRG
jgi:hypothetical protein